MEDFEKRVLYGLEHLDSAIKQIVGTEPVSQNDTPVYVAVGPGNTEVIPNGLKAYSIMNDGDSDILLNGVALKPGMVVSPEVKSIKGVLIGTTVQTQLSSAFIVKIA
jgi:hypothetical protein